MWSEISIRSPGGMSGRNEPAALVRISRLGAERAQRLERRRITAASPLS